MGLPALPLLAPQADLQGQQQLQRPGGLLQALLPAPGLKLLQRQRREGRLQAQLPAPGLKSSQLQRFAGLKQAAPPALQGQQHVLRPGGVLQAQLQAFGVVLLLRRQAQPHHLLGQQHLRHAAAHTKPPAARSLL